MLAGCCQQTTQQAEAPLPPPPKRRFTVETQELDTYRTIIYVTDTATSNEFFIFETWSRCYVSSMAQVRK
jgi:hypothetical protein